MRKSTLTAAHVSMSVTRDLSHGCNRYVRDYGHAIAFLSRDLIPAREDQENSTTTLVCVCEVRCGRDTRCLLFIILLVTPRPPVICVGEATWAR
jgi:hypothetical protein